MMINDLRNRTIQAVNSSIYKIIDDMLEKAAMEGECSFKLDKEAILNSAKPESLMYAVKNNSKSIELKYKLEGLDVLVSTSVVAITFSWDV